MNALLIKPMAEPDLLAYKSLRDHMLAAHPDAFTSDAEAEGLRDLASYRSRLTGGSTLFTLLAWQTGQTDRSGQLAGAVTCEREPRRKVAHIAHLIGMMVAPAHQGQGVGRALVAQTLARLQADTSLALVTLSVTASNAAAVGLYASAGFERYGLLPDAIRLADGRSLAKALMLRRLR